MNWVLQVFMNPTLAYRTVRERAPVFLPVILIFLVLGGTGILLGPILARDNAEMISQNPKLAEMLTEEQMENIRSPSGASRVIGIVSSPILSLIGLALYSLLLLIAANVSGCEVRYRMAFSAILAAALIDPVLASLVKAPLILAKGSSLGVSTSLSLLATDAPITSVKYMVLEVFDLFGLWSLAVLVAGFAVVAKIGQRKAALIVVAVWIVKSAAVILMSVVSTRLSGMAG